MFRKVLIANRGEIALRIMRACRELDIETVAIFSEADRESLHVRLADEAYCVGPPASARSYLNIPNIVSAATLADVDAVHPGYGLLAEIPYFAEICESHGIKFIGPSSEAIELMGDKALAKATMQRAGVPVVPGSEGAVKNDRQARQIAADIGYPVMIKASAGGGGKGMRVARSESELVRFISMARAEADASFGSDEVYIEKYLENPRHIEVQVLADEHGHVIHLGERDCSSQRRYQKLIEEAPAPGLAPDLRERIAEAAVRAAEACSYTNAGTVEFLVDADGGFYFSEMNTRIQVEHPVTELVTGIDIVRWQLLIAAGEPLAIQQSDVKMRGHAIECRINAEDPYNDFAPCPGRINFYSPPGGNGVRVDSSAYSGYMVSPFYDAMIAKLIVWDDSREKAIARMKAALYDFVIDGVKTTIPFHQEVLESPEFHKGGIGTDFIARFCADRGFEAQHGGERDGGSGGHRA